MRPETGGPVRDHREDAGCGSSGTRRATPGFFPARALRLACPCAGCVEEMTGRPLLDPGLGAAGGPAAVAGALVGAYGLRIDWSDGHGTGIYTFERLRPQLPLSALSGPAYWCDRMIAPHFHFPLIGRGVWTWIWVAPRPRQCLGLVPAVQWGRETHWSNLDEIAPWCRHHHSYPPA